MLSLVLQFVLVVVNAEAEREVVVGVLSSSVLLDPEITVDSSKNETLWAFKGNNKSHDVILNHIPGGTTVQPSKQFKGRLQFNALTGELMISRLNARDQGDYTFAVGGKELKIMELLVVDKVKEKVGLLGSSVLLDPELKADPSKSEIVWAFIGRSILHHVPGHSSVEQSDQFKSRLHFNTSNGALTVNGTEHGDQGDYTFMVDGQELRIIDLHLFERLSKPLINSNSTFVDTDIALVCHIPMGIPRSVLWMKDNEVITSGQYQFMENNGTLLISQAKKSDCGLYSCLVENAVSKENNSYQLYVYGFSTLHLSTLSLSIAALIFGGAIFIGIIISYLHEKDTITLHSQKMMLLFQLCAAALSLILLFAAILCWGATAGYSDILVTMMVILCLLLILTFSAMCSMKKYDTKWINDMFSSKFYRVNLDVVSPLSGFVVICSSSILISQITKESGKGCKTPARLQGSIVSTVVVPLIILVIIFSIYAFCYAKDGKQQKTQTPQDEDVMTGLTETNSANATQPP